MTTTANNIYINSVFEFTVLTKITEKPDYESLTNIKVQLKANADKWEKKIGEFKQIKELEEKCKKEWGALKLKEGKEE